VGVSFAIFTSLSFSILSASSYREAVSLYQRGQYREAEEVYLSLIEENPRKVIYYLDLASLYKEQGAYQAAIEILKKSFLFNEDKDIPRQASKFLGTLYYLKGEPEQALGIFKKTAKGTKDWEAYLYLGLTYEDLGRLSLAEKYYLESIKYKKTSLATYRLAKIYYETKRYKKAALYFRKTIEIDPSIRLAYYYLGESLFRDKDYQSAYRFLSRVINFYPRAEIIKNRLELTKKKLGRDFFLERRSLIEKKRKEIKLASYKKVATGIKQVRVKILEAKQFSFKCGGKFQISDKKRKVLGDKDKFYTICVENDGKIHLYHYHTDEEIAVLDYPLEIKTSNFPFYILSVTYGEGNFWQKDLDEALRGYLEVGVKQDKLVLINVLSLEEYLYGVVPAEIPANSPFEALKAQAVAARTIAFRNLGRHQKEGFDFCSDTHCQVYQGKTGETPITNLAVDETRGEVIFYQEEAIEAFYHANCGGCQRGDAFGAKPYLFSNKLDNAEDGLVFFGPWQEWNWLKEGEISFCSTWGRANFRWQRVYDEDDFKIAFGFHLEDLERIEPGAKGDCGHLKRVKLKYTDKSKLIEGDLGIRDYFDNLKSSAFKIEVKYNLKNKIPKPQMLFIWGAGFGHGVGLCQQGAINMAKEGYDYKEILKHYYKDVEIKKVY
jgi:SpoIID/LytB domain protein